MSPKELSDIRRKLRIIQHGRESGNISKTCRYFGVSRETYYKWKKDYGSKGESALVNSKPCPQNPKLRIAADIEAQIVHLRTTYHLGQLRISWYIELVPNPGHGKLEILGVLSLYPILDTVN